jgi:hypothetical protein
MRRPATHEISNISYHREHQDGPRNTIWLKAQIHVAPKLPNEWLAWSFADALTEASRLGIRPLEAFAVELFDRSQDLNVAYSHSTSLGYFLEH